MNAEELKQLVKEKYSKIAEQSEIKSSCCSTGSCCGPTVDYTVFSESYSEKEGYNPEADMNLGCGIPTDYAGIKNGDHVLDLGSGAGALERLVRRTFARLRGADGAVRPGMRGVQPRPDAADGRPGAEAGGET